MKTKRWFLVRAICGHAVNCLYKERLVFIYGKDINEVLSEYGRLPSVKKDIGTYPFPNIKPMDNNEVKCLEKLVVKRGRISFNEVRERGYYFLGNDNYDSLLSIVTNK